MLAYFHRSAPWTRDPWRTRLDGEQWIVHCTESVLILFSAGMLCYVMLLLRGVFRSVMAESYAQCPWIGGESWAVRVYGVRETCELQSRALRMIHGVLHRRALWTEAIGVLFGRETVSMTQRSGFGEAGADALSAAVEARIGHVVLPQGREAWSSAQL